MGVYALDVEILKMQFVSIYWKFHETRSSAVSFSGIQTRNNNVFR